MILCDLGSILSDLLLDSKYSANRHKSQSADNTVIHILNGGLQHCRLK